MDANAKKTTLRMIPYGLFVLTAAHPDGRVAAATINWVTQASFEPPLVAIGVKADSHGHALIKDPNGLTIELNFFGMKDVTDWGGEDYSKMPQVATMRA